MDYLVFFFSSAATLSGAILLGAVIVGRRKIAVDCRGCGLPPGEVVQGGALSEVGISVVVRGAQNRAQITARLGMDYTMYEVVIVADFGRTEGFDELRRHFGMIKMEQRNREIPSCPESITIYRSRQKRYKRVVFVESASKRAAEQVNCGVLAASFDYVTVVEGDTFLTSDALGCFNDILSESGAESVAAFAGFRTAGGDMAKIDLMMSFALAASGVKGLLRTVKVCDREQLIASGGKGEPAAATPVKKRMLALAEPLCRRRGRFWGRAAAIVTAALAAVILAADGTARHTAAVLLALTAAYLSAAAAAAVAATAARNAPKSPFAPLWYPFYRLAHTFRGKNFVK